MSNDHDHERDNADNPLADIDLAAWDVPGPSAGFAEAVQARLAAAPAVEPSPSRTPRTWWIVGGLAAVIASAAIALLVVARGGGATTVPADGEVVATGVRHLDLGTAWAELEPGARVAWHHDHDGLIIEQDGAATWTVASERLQIKTGDGIPPVEATGASLRMETHMNRIDTRVMGVSAMTAAAVALTAVIVFRGQVSVDGSGTALVIPAGSTLELRAGVSPGVPTDVAALDSRVHALQTQVDQLQQQLVAGGGPASVPPSVPAPPAPAPPAPPTPVPQKTVAQPCDAGALAKRAKTEIAAGQYAAATLSLQDSERCANDPSLYMLVVLASCNSSNARVARDYFAKLETAQKFGATEMCKRNKISLIEHQANDDPAPTHTGPCDAANLAQEGKDEINNGKYAAAVASLEASLQCQTDPSLYRLVLLAACNSGNARVAKRYFAKMPVSQQSSAAQMCIRNNIDLEDPPAPSAAVPPKPACDAPSLTQQGKDEINVGQYQAALVSLEASLQCHADPSLYRLILLAACNSANPAKAKEYFAKLPASQQSSASEMCKRNYIPLP